MGRTGGLGGQAIFLDDSFSPPATTLEDRQDRPADQLALMVAPRRRRAALTTTQPGRAAIAVH